MPDSPPPPRRQRSTCAIVGITLGVVALLGLVVLGIAAAILFPVFARSRAAARNAGCQSNLKQLGLGVMMYVQDYDERYPPADMWAEVLVPYAPSTDVYECPSGGGYAFNSELSGLGLWELSGPAECPALFESEAGSAPFHLANSNDPVTSFVKRHPFPDSSDAHGNVAYADGYVTEETSPPEARAGFDENDGEGFFFE